MMATRNITLSHRNEDTLALAVEPSLIRACLIEAVGNEQRLTGWITVQRDRHAAISGQIAAMCTRLGTRLGRDLWDEAGNRPLLGPPVASHLPSVRYVTAAANPRPRLRVWLAGLSAQVSLAAAGQAVLATQSEVVGESVLSSVLSADQLAADFTRMRPEALVVVGGHDDKALNAQQPLLSLCEILGQTLDQLPADARPTVFFAGNRWVASQAQLLLTQEDGQDRFEMVANVKPASNSIYLTELARAVQREQWRRARGGMGIAAIEQWVTGPARLTALDWSFAQLVQVWMAHHSMAELYGVYRTDHWHQHVWARSDQSAVRMAYTEPTSEGPGPGGWPALQLLCGSTAGIHDLPPTLRWWDRSGMAPMVATIGQISPAGMLQVLDRDLFGV